jgi:hypothetical protein
MLSNIENAPKDSEKPVENKIRKPYVTPSLESLGDLRTQTLGGSVLDVADWSEPYNTRPL